MDNKVNFEIQSFFGGANAEKETQRKLDFFLGLNWFYYPNLFSKCVFCYQFFKI